MDLTELAKQGKLDPTIGRDEGVHIHGCRLWASVVELTRRVHRNKENYPEYALLYRPLYTM